MSRSATLLLATVQLEGDANASANHEAAAQRWTADVSCEYLEWDYFKKWLLIVPPADLLIMWHSIIIMDILKKIQ